MFTWNELYNTKVPVGQIQLFVKSYKKGLIRLTLECDVFNEVLKSELQHFKHLKPLKHYI